MKRAFPNELVYQVFALLSAFILIHALYVVLIRPQAEGFLRQEAASLRADGIEQEGLENKEIIALIAYLQRLGTDIKPPAQAGN